jgi:REP element-mobilizing transposase RayT
MARLARVVIPGVPHHVTQRGNNRGRTFFDDGDYALYLDMLAESSARARTAVWAYCLMPNHVHIILEPSDTDGLRRTFADLHRRYTSFINVRARTTGHLWQGRYGSVTMDEAHLINAVRYVTLNPVRARLVARAAAWPWSSARAHLAGALAEWSEFDLSENVWTVPAERAKNGIANRVPLSPLALDLLKQVKKGSGQSRFLFPSPRSRGSTGEKPIGPGSISHALRNNLGDLGLEGVTPHDLRRTAVSLMTGMGISRLVAEKIINHKDRGVASIYDRHSYEAEKRHALEAWSACLEEIVEGKPEPDNIVELHA